MAQACGPGCEDPWGFLDHRGDFAIPPRYLRAEDFTEGLAATAVAAPPTERR